jgi:hypothetical protein
MQGTNKQWQRNGSGNIAIAEKEECSKSA